MDAICGITKEMLAELMAKHTGLRTQHGEAQGRAAFERLLATKGLSMNDFANANNAWQDRFRADRTGRTEAAFQMALQAAMAQAHFGDVRDMTADVREGVSLDTYAAISVAAGEPGADFAAVLARFGLSNAQWQKGSAAWTKAMSEDTSHALSMQYGQLYAKHKGPAFAENMAAQTAAARANAGDRRDVVDEPQEELTPELCLQKMQSLSRNERWTYARHYARMADLGNVPDKAAAIRTVAPHLIEILERHDEDTASDAEAAVGWLWDLEVQTSEVRGAVSRCHNRAQERLATFEQAFAPIQHKNVPERIRLQGHIQDFTSLVNTMGDYLEREWNTTPSAAPANPYAASPVHISGIPGPFEVPNLPSLPAMPFGRPSPVIMKVAMLAAPLLIIGLVGLGLVGRARIMTARAHVAGGSAQVSAPVQIPAAKPVAPAAPVAPKFAEVTPAPSASHAAAPAAASAARAPKAAKKKPAKH
jgi:hypothetical protein